MNANEFMQNMTLPQAVRVHKDLRDTSKWNYADESTLPSWLTSLPVHPTLRALEIGRIEKRALKLLADTFVDHML